MKTKRGIFGNKERADGAYYIFDVWLSGFLGSLCVVYNCHGAADLHIACLDQVGLDVALDMVWFTDISWKWCLLLRLLCVQD